MDQYNDDNVGDIGAVPICQSCGSERVVKDAWAIWNPAHGLWELEQVFDGEYCHHCESETRFDWKRLDAAEPRQAIRELNDSFRQHGRGHGSVLLTQGVQALEPGALRQVIEAVQSFDAFSKDNDPWGEHDFGAVEIGGEKIFWKIDAYDPTLTRGSDNPANEAITHRVLTIMLASEY